VHVRTVANRGVHDWGILYVASLVVYMDYQLINTNKMAGLGVSTTYSTDIFVFHNVMSLLWRHVVCIENIS
jgi:hypothetical protein